MKKMKRYIAAALAAVFALSLAPVAVASGPAELRVECTVAQAEQGDSFFVLVKLEKNPGVCAVQLKVEYEAEILSLEKFERGSLIPAGVMLTTNTKKPGMVKLSAVSTQSILGDGTLLVLTFKAISAGESALTLAVEVFADGDGASLSTLTRAASVSVSDVAPSPPSKPDTAPVTVFRDVPQSHWAYSAIQAAAKAGLFNGVGDELFQPDGTLSRAMLATLLCRQAQGSAKGTPIFADVLQDAWYAEAVAWASENGIVEGTGNNLFSPNVSVTREQAAVMLHRYCGLPPADAELSFADAGEISTWARDAMRWAIETGLFTGRSNNLLAPAETCTRAEAAAMFSRLPE